MNKTIRHILLLMLLPLLLGCTADSSVGEGATVAPQAISFGVYTSHAATRADSTIFAESGIPGGASIGVYCYYHDNTTWSSTATPNFMFNQEVVNNGVEGYTYSPVKYWPNENSDKLSFIAYYPHVASGTAYGITPLFTNVSTGLPSFEFTVDNDVSKQVDFLVSDFLPNLPNGTDAVSPSSASDREELRIIDHVKFKFYHMTSKIEFRIVVDDKIKDDLAYFTIKSLKLTNIYNSGKVTPVYPAETENSALDTPKESTTSFQWAGHSDSYTAKTDYNCKTDEAYLLLPQTLRDDAKLTITYDLAFKSNGTTYKYNSGTPISTDVYVYNDHTEEVQLNTLKLKSTNPGTGEETQSPFTRWETNHHYVYTIRLDANPIGFTGQVVAWGEELPWPVNVENLVVN